MPSAVQEPQGFPQPATAAVKMSPSHRLIEATTTQTDEPLWTENMSDCISVATYNTETSFRSLCHLPGGKSDSSLTSQLADIIDEHTVVLFTNGTSADPGFLDGRKKDIMNEVEEKLQAKQKEGGLYKPYYTDPNQDAAHGLKAGTFLIGADGRYGRIQAQQTQGQGQKSQGSQGNTRRRTGKGGCWKKMFCCCCG